MTEIKRVVALGFFDGVHLGHAALIEKTASRAAEKKAEPAVVSFDIHPDSLVKGETVPLINSAADREEIVERIFGIHSVILIHFDEKMMHMPWQQFAEYLRDTLQVVHVVVGHDFRFGFRGEGTPERLSAFCAANGIGIDIIPKVELNGVTVSSTYIRGLLAEGNMEEADAFLGHPYCLTDIVHRGFQLGRTIGVPTINLFFSDGVLIPKHGVYAARACFDGKCFNTVTNVGVRPTVGGTDTVNVESHLLDFSGDLYDKQVRIDFLKFLRPEQKFESIDALRQQIALDEETARAFFAHI